MFKRVLMVFVLFLVSAVVMAQDAGREFYGWHWYDDGIHFNYFYSADNVGSRWIPASGNLPEKAQLFFENYHGDGQWIETGATIDIIPVSTLPSGLSTLPETIRTLQSSGGDIPNQLSQIIQSGDIPVTAAYPVFLEFQSGTGVRFIAAAGDSMNPMRLSYRYLGITSDGHYVVMALFPLEADNLSNLDILSPEFVELDTMISTLSVASPDCMMLTAQTNATVAYNGIHFTYDASLAYRVEVDAIAAVAGAEAENTMYGVTPGYQQFSFAGYPVTDYLLAPQLFVMPVSEFPDAQHIYGVRLQELQTLLAQHPQLSAVAGGNQNALPLLPVLNAAQTIVSQPHYMRFGNGEGVRYITYYSQGVNPITSTDLFYTFAGISDDGQYVVAATFPLYAGFLPEREIANNITDWDNFNMNYQTYLGDMLLHMEAMDGNVYMPQIHLLDELITSVTVTQEEFSPPMCANEIL